MKSFSTRFIPDEPDKSFHCITYNAQYAYLEHRGLIPVFPKHCKINYTLDSRWIQIIESLISNNTLALMAGSRGYEKIVFMITSGRYDQIMFVGVKQDEEVDKFLGHSNIHYFDQYCDVDGWVNKLGNTIEEDSERILCLLFTGAPKQDLISARLHELISGSKVLHTIGLGGSYRVWTDKVRPCPSIITYLGLEGLWRLCSDPSKEKFFRAFKSLIGLYAYIMHLR